jgi:CheY-like chemotaxis protein
MVVVRDGAEALEYIFGTGQHAGRDLSILPAVILLDLKLPRIDGLEVIRRIRADEPTRLLPIVVLTASREEEDMSGAIRSAPTPTSASRSISRSSWTLRTRSEPSGSRGTSHLPIDRLRGE